MTYIIFTRKDIIMTSNANWASPGPDFKVNAFCQDLSVTPDNDILLEFKKLLESDEISLILLDRNRFS